MDLKGVIVTIDAMGCQKEIAKKITEKESDYLFLLKGNQGKIHESVKEFFEKDMNEKCLEEYKIQKSEKETEVEHGRIQTRQYFCVQTWIGLKKLVKSKWNRNGKN